MQGTGFRPLSGNLIFQSFSIICSAVYNLFPSPIGESYFSIRILRYGSKCSNTCFRPLSGNLIFQFIIRIISAAEK